MSDFINNALKVSILGYEPYYSNVAMVIIKPTTYDKEQKFNSGDAVQCALVTFQDDTLLINGNITSNTLHENNKGAYFVKFRQKHYLNDFLRYDKNKVYNVKYV